MKNLIGKKFNRLTVIEITNERNRGGSVVWLCECECGNSRLVDAPSLKKGDVKSCGCYKNGKVNCSQNLKKLYEVEYNCWKSMKRRCFNKNVSKYKNYGGRGITVCERWLSSFKNFIDDMGKRPSIKHSIDRYPNQNGNYEPSNCRWATIDQQSRNKRNNVYITYRQETKVLMDWVKQLKCSTNQFSRYIKRGFSYVEIIDHYKGIKKIPRSTKREKELRLSFLLS